MCAFALRALRETPPLRQDIPYIFVCAPCDWKHSRMRSSTGLTILRCLAVLCTSSAYGADPEARQAVLQEESCGVTGGCATTDLCNDDGLDVECAVPAAFVCEHQLPGLSVCESPLLAAMLPCWMSSIDGTLTLSEISIPGTHNTMAKGSTACFQDGLANIVYTQVRVEMRCSSCCFVP